MGAAFTSWPVSSRSPSESRRSGGTDAAPAQADLIEWGPQSNAEDQLASVLKRQRSLQRLIDRAPDAPVLSDDQPLNEYYLIRQARQAGRKRED